MLGNLCVALFIIVVISMVDFSSLFLDDETEKLLYYEDSEFEQDTEDTTITESEDNTDSVSEDLVSSSEAEFIPEAEFVSGTDSLSSVQKSSKENTNNVIDGIDVDKISESFIDEVYSDWSETDGVEK